MMTRGQNHVVQYSTVLQSNCDLFCSFKNETTSSTVVSVSVWIACKTARGSRCNLGHKYGMRVSRIV
jgi:hypothetical protein